MLATSQTGVVDSDLIELASDRMATSFPDTVQRCQGLLEWFAAGSGRCSGFPVHEVVAGQHTVARVSRCHCLSGHQAGGQRSDRARRVEASRGLAGVACRRLSEDSRWPPRQTHRACLRGPGQGATHTVKVSSVTLGLANDRPYRHAAARLPPRSAQTGAPGGSGRDMSVRLHNTTRPHASLAAAAQSHPCAQ
jgi:hypothetical protein